MCTVTPAQSNLASVTQHTRHLQPFWCSFPLVLLQTARKPATAQNSLYSDESVKASLAHRNICSSCRAVTPRQSAVKCSAENRKLALLEGRTRLVAKLSSEINAAEFVKQTVPQCQQPIKDKTEESSHKPCRAEAASRTERSTDPLQHNAAAQ